MNITFKGTFNNFKNVVQLISATFYLSFDAFKYIYRKLLFQTCGYNFFFFLPQVVTLVYV